MIHVALIGLDMSHAVAFAQLLNDPSHPHAIPGARVVAGYVGGSDDIAISRDRRDEYTRTVRDQLGVRIVDFPSEAAEAADLVLITAVDGRAHRALFEAVAPSRKPTFIGKPMALNLADAMAMFRLARQVGVTLSSCSALRVFAAGAGADAVQTPQSCDIFGPTSDQSTQPGLFWYGIHCIEMAIAVMGVGCAEVRSISNEKMDLTTLHWPDGRTATVRGLRSGPATFGLTVNGPNGPHYRDTAALNEPMTATLLRAILSSIPHGRPVLPEADTIEVIRIIEAANLSQQTGKSVALPPLPPNLD